MLRRLSEYEISETDFDWFGRGSYKYVKRATNYLMTWNLQTDDFLISEFKNILFVNYH